MPNPSAEPEDLANAPTIEPRQRHAFTLQVSVETERISDDEQASRVHIVDDFAHIVLFCRSEQAAELLAHTIRTNATGELTWRRR